MFVPFYQFVDFRKLTYDKYLAIARMSLDTISQFYLFHILQDLSTNHVNDDTV